ncbi:unnamed protein product, partial [Cyprideis torosa]
AHKVFVHLFRRQRESSLLRKLHLSFRNSNFPSNKGCNADRFIYTCLSNKKADINTTKNEVELDSEGCNADRFIYTCLSNKKADIFTAKNEVELESEVCYGDCFICTCFSRKKVEIITTKKNSRNFGQ